MTRSLYLTPEGSVAPEKRREGRRASDRHARRWFVLHQVVIAALLAVIFAQGWADRAKREAERTAHAQAIERKDARIQAVAPERDPGHCEEYVVAMEGWTLLHCHRTVTRL